MPKALNWDDTPAFLAVARAGTLTGAAQLLSTGVATVSRRIERLEDALGVPLFARHQTGYKLTDDGAALIPRAEALEEAMSGFRTGAAAQTQIVGHVRLATAENLANPIIIPSLPALLHRHPDLTLDVLTDVTTLNLHRRDADLALRMVRPTRGNVTVRRVGTLGFGLYASPDYLSVRRKNPDGEAFENDSFIGWSDQLNSLPAARWIERTLRGKNPILTTTTLSAQLAAAKAGLGLAILPHFLAQESGLCALPVSLGLDQSIWLVSHADLSASQRIRAVADHLVETIRANGRRLANGNLAVTPHDAD